MFCAVSKCFSYFLFVIKLNRVIRIVTKMLYLRGPTLGIPPNAVNFDRGVLWR